MKRSIPSLLAAAALAIAPTSTCRADEDVYNVTITSTLKTRGISWNDWDVTACFDIRRDKQPAGNIYIKAYLSEEDVLWDNTFGPQVKCVAPADWAQRADGTFEARVCLTFRGVSDFWGNDWAIDDDDVDEISCADAKELGFCSTFVDPLGGQYLYVHTIVNDPDGIAMNPDAVAVMVQIGDRQYPLPNLRQGQQVTIQTFDDRPPPQDSESGGLGYTVPYVVFFSDGGQSRGLTTAPDPGPADCNLNGVSDYHEVLAGQADDCNHDFVPDQCQGSGYFTDCDGDGIPDCQAIAQGLVSDCNGNETPDACDVAMGWSADDNGDGVPDDCNADCDGDTVPDDQELDCDGDGRVDDCDPSHCPADLAAPFGILNVFDFLAFQTAFSNQDPCADLAAPFGVFNVFDFLAFQTAFGNGC